MIDNEFRPDLEPELWDGDEITIELSEAGKRMDDLDLLPAPFPVHEFLPERDLRHVMRLYQVGGLSYGNLSARKDENRFWMSASGVDKSQLETVGRDMLLVVDYDEPNARIVLSVPPGIEPRRVSVDAIEHWMIYQRHPDVGDSPRARLDGGHPGDRRQLSVRYAGLAESVAELIDRERTAHAVIGLRNHGITATGESLSGSSTGSRRSSCAKCRCPRSADAVNRDVPASTDPARALVEAGIALTSELALDAVLEKLVRSAAELTHARYAALGVIDTDGVGLEQFVTHGISASDRAASARSRAVAAFSVSSSRTLARCGSPTSRAIPLRRPAQPSADEVPRRPRHAARRRLRQPVPDRAGGEVHQGDEELVTILAAQAAVAVENARLYEAVTRWSRQLESLNEIAAALTSEIRLSRQLELVTTRLRELPTRVSSRLRSLADGRS